MMIIRLQEVQACLPTEYRSALILRNRLLNATRGVDACRLAIQKPSPTVQGVTADLQSAVQGHVASPSSHQIAGSSNVSALIVDRKYKRSKNSKRKCYVCGKIGCYSTKHPYQECLKSLKKNRKHLRALVAAVEDVKSDSEDSESLETFDAFAIDMMGEIADNEGGTDTTAEEEYSMAQLRESTPNPHCNIVHFVHRTQDVSTCHSLTATVLKPGRYTSQEFYGNMIDTGCSYASTAGIGQYLAYCAYVGIDPKTDSANVTVCAFRVGEVQSRVAEVQFPFSGRLLEILLHVVDADVPMLLSLADMDILGLYYNNVSDLLIHSATNTSVGIVRKFGHPFYSWSPILHCMYTETELHRLHRRFGHPHVDKLIQFLHRVENNKVSENTRALLLKIAKYCKACQIYSYKPRRFKFTLCDDVDFNHSIYIDIFYVDGDPILHVVDEATRYQAAR